MKLYQDYDSWADQVRRWEAQENGDRVLKRGTYRKQVRKPKSVYFLNKLTGKKIEVK
jgi:hypothetical protein